MKKKAGCPFARDRAFLDGGDRLTREEAARSSDNMNLKQIAAVGILLCLRVEAKEPRKYQEYREGFEKAQGVRLEEIEGSQIWSGGIYYHHELTGYYRYDEWLGLASIEPGPASLPNRTYGFFRLAEQGPTPQDRTISTVFESVFAQGAIRGMRNARFSERRNALVLPGKENRYLLRKGTDIHQREVYFVKILELEDGKVSDFPSYGYFRKMIYQEKNDGKEYVSPSCAAMLINAPVNPRTGRITSQRRS